MTLLLLEMHFGKIIFSGRVLCRGGRQGPLLSNLCVHLVALGGLLVAILGS